jgi:hypothetical protein
MKRYDSMGRVLDVTANSVAGAGLIAFVALLSLFGMAVITCLKGVFYYFVPLFWLMLLSGFFGDAAFQCMVGVTAWVFPISLLLHACFRERELWRRLVYEVRLTAWEVKHIN